MYIDSAFIRFQHLPADVFWVHISCEEQNRFVPTLITESDKELSHHPQRYVLDIQDSDMLGTRILENVGQNEYPCHLIILTFDHLTEEMSRFLMNPVSELRKKNHFVVGVCVDENEDDENGNKLHPDWLPIEIGYKELIDTFDSLIITGRYAFGENQPIPNLLNQATFMLLSLFIEASNLNNYTFPLYTLGSSGVGYYHLYRTAKSILAEYPYEEAENALIDATFTCPFFRANRFFYHCFTGMEVPEKTYQFVSDCMWYTSSILADNYGGVYYAPALSENETRFEFLFFDFEKKFPLYDDKGVMVYRKNEMPYAIGSLFDVCFGGQSFSEINKSDYLDEDFRSEAEEKERNAKLHRQGQRFSALLEDFPNREIALKLAEL